MKESQVQTTKIGLIGLVKLMWTAQVTNAPKIQQCIAILVWTMQVRKKLMLMLKGGLLQVCHWYKNKLEGNLKRP